MRIIHYPHPALRHKSKPLSRIDADFKKIVREMFDLMYEHKGVGLAANQVELPYRFFIINLEGDPAKAPEFVFLNPVISRRSGTVEKEEGCLSFPEIYAEISRPGSVEVKALNDKMKPVEFRAGGLLSRVIQHELDHLNGILFIDRMTKKTKEEIRDELDELQAATKSELALKKGGGS